jgi:hypothetical protein
MAQYRTLTADQDGSQPPSLSGDKAMANGIHTRVKPVQSTAPQPSADRAGLQPEVSQLMAGNDAVLPVGQVRNQSINRLSLLLCSHIGLGCSFGRHAA